MTVLLSTAFLMVFTMLTFGAGIFGWYLWFSTGFWAFIIYYFLVGCGLAGTIEYINKHRQTKPA